MFALRNRSASAARLRARLYSQALESRDAPAIFTVNTATDTGAGAGLTGDLRYCINQANALAGADTINFALGGPATITLGSALPALTDKIGTTTISGPGETSLTINGNQKGSVIRINASVAASISGLTITGGKTAIDGGGIFAQFSNTVTLTNLTISGNSSGSTFGGGGILLNTGGKLTADNLTLSNNVNNYFGGGICINNGAQATITNSNLFGNSAGFDGGGAHVAQAGSLTITSTTVAGNTAGPSQVTSTGGGISNLGSLTVSKSSVIGNSAPAGGGIYNAGTLSLADSTVHGNMALDGGGINSVNKITVSNSTLSGNSATKGGAMLVFAGSTPATLINTTVSGNSASNGGGIYFAGTATSMNLRNTTVSGNSASTGGGLKSSASGTVTATNSIIAGNFGSDLAGNPLHVGSSNNLVNMSAIAAGLGTLGNSGGPTQTIPLLPGSPAIDAGNNAAAAGLIYDQRGFGPRINNGTVDIGAFEFGAVSQLVVTTISDTTIPVGGKISLRQAINFANAHLGPDTITFNLGGPATITLNGTQLPTLVDTIGATTIVGPGAHLLIIDANQKSRVFQLNSNVVASIDGVTITGGKQVGGGGGGILALPNTTVTLTNSVLTGNSAEGSGGGIWHSYLGKLIVANSIISGNSANGVSGGGIYAGSGVQVTISNSTLSGNSSGHNGGALSNNGGTWTITDAKIIGNTGSSGGGIVNFGTLNVSNSTFSGNLAFEGGGIYSGSGSVTLSNSIFSGNSAGKWGGGINNRGTLTADGTTVTGNSAGSVGNPSAVGGGICNSGTMTVTDSTIDGNSAIAQGGGIESIISGSVTVIRSTVSGNSAGTGGGIGVGFGTQIVVTNSILYGNSTGLNGGGILANNNCKVIVANSSIIGNIASLGGGIFAKPGSIVMLTNSTASGNVANQAGGIHNSGAMTLNSSIIAGNTATSSSDVFGAVTQTNSLINMTAGTAGLGALGNYGGATQTIPLLPGSPAIDAGNSTIALDQRGLPRFGLPDIGAFESQGFVFSASGSGQTANINTKFANLLSVTITPNNPLEPVDGAVFTFTPPATGASAVLSAATVTVVNGTAAVTATANGTSGNYGVTVTSGTFATSFALTNMGPPNVSYAKLIGGNLSVAFGNQGNDVEVFGHTGAVTVRSNSTLVGVYAVTGTITVTSGTGADTITLTVDSGLALPNLVTLNAGGGDDVVNVGSSASLPGSVPNLTLNLGDGNNRLIDSGLKITGSWNINAGAGHDTIGPLVSPVGNRLSISAGNGNNTATVLNKAGSQVFYQGGSGADDVTFGGAHGNNLYVFLGAGADTFTFAPGSAINYGFIDFGADVDTYIPNGVVVGSGLTLQNL